MSLQNRLILFFFVTSLGSALSSVAAFLSIENFFNSLIFLGIALSVRTLASALFSYISNNVIQKLGLHLSLLISQLFGCLALVVLFFGFYFNIFALTILGIILTGLPATFVAILLSIILRVSSENSDTFRKYSGRRELVFGIAMLLASLLAPLLLYKFSLNLVLLMDGFSYVCGFFLLTNLKLTEQLAPNENNESIPLRKLFFSSKSVSSFLLKTSASLLLAGLLPLLASSSSIEFTANMPVLMRQWLWAIEDVTAISASLIYLIFTVLRRQKWFESLVMLSGIWLLIPLLFSGNTSIVIAAIVICLLTDFSGQKFRDDLVISAGDDAHLIKAYSAIAQLQRNFIFFLSPLLLTFLLTYANTTACVAILFLIQLSFYLLYKKFFKNHYVVVNEKA